MLSLSEGREMLGMLGMQGVRGQDLLSFLQLLPLAQLSCPLSLSHDFLFYIKLGMKARVHMCNPRLGETGAGKPKVGAILGYIMSPCRKRNNKSSGLITSLGHHFLLKAPV